MTKVFYNQRVSIEKLLAILDGYKFKEFHIHCTWLPNYSTIKGRSHEAVNDSMKNYHISKKWGTIAQHISTFPDGDILIGRDFAKKPCSIKGYNTGSFCMEMVGDFDLGKDIITVAQRDITLKLIKYFKSRNTKIVFHRERSNKTCPGTSLSKKGLIEASDYYLNKKELRKGITGEDVAEVQKVLGIEVDGSFGPETERVLKLWQKANGIKETGVIDEVTKNALFTNADNPSDWAKESWNYCKEKRILDGTRPHDFITREEVSIVIERILKKKGD